MSSHSEAAFDLEESFRRAEAARGMSMDVSRVLGIDSWPVEALMSGASSPPPAVPLALPGLTQPVRLSLQLTGNIGTGHLVAEALICCKRGQPKA